MYDARIISSVLTFYIARNLKVMCSKMISQKLICYDNTMYRLFDELFRHDNLINFPCKLHYKKMNFFLITRKFIIRRI